MKALAVGFSMHVHVASTAAVAASPQMNEILEYLTVFILSVFVGIEVISKVPSILHTPLMSGSNAIHGVILVGAMLVLGGATTTPETILGVLAVVLATMNVVGGFVVTDRMLEMFKGKPQEKKKNDEGDS
ncbi:MAG TPA: NAD(P) transhydrogenase subunit alpha [Acidimicrobiales bacterium]|jgi:NAD(P) transhydrogenase subunit alpha|nr:NAD(P) transhydrogenase subunit alpha [Acidimicrobiales bacterium]